MDLLLRDFARRHPIDTARTLERLPRREVAVMLEKWGAEDASEVVSRMITSTGADCLRLVAPSTAAETLSEMPPERAASILRMIPASQASTIAEKLQGRSAKTIRRLLEVPEETAGALTDSAAPVVPEDFDAKSALEAVRRKRTRTGGIVYVVDRDTRLRGQVNIQTLLMADPEEAVANLMRPPLLMLPAGASVHALRSHPAWAETDELPVVDSHERFLGVVPHRAMRRLAFSDTISDTSGGGLGALLGLGEMIWMGLSGTFESLTSSSAPALASSQEDRDHG
jgi:Mg/Co/Ni transporter MgtE